ncbi:65-kDa microtubule-associated protein 3-like isoform X2 [Actinidia eriantha]|uniref:65-kDa microtubule-associated protein 3-like isoform X2 n=1 Tax=Actinidia eriantha TaxID=165200 RepID=UPI0025868E11|nr:65-kDa microtubule-associated protein 3-like isoform X2 [Actinidia eriantha]
MSKVQKDPLLQVETTCGSLLYELQVIWDEVGESETEREKMLLELEQECMEVYRRKVDQANRCRAQLRKAIADSEAELAAICSAMGERPVNIRQSDKKPGSLKEELRAILPQVEETQKRKCDRRNQFVEVLEQIRKISTELYTSSEHAPSSTFVDQNDLSLRKLDELQRELQALQNEKSDRLKHMFGLLNTLDSLCLVLGIDVKQTINEIHPSLGNDSEGMKNINNDTIEQLGTSIQQLRELKLQRMQRLQDLASSLLELWNLMDTPIEEQQMFQNVTCNIAASEHEITEPNMLAMDLINNVVAEVSRLEELKVSKMKELVLKKRSELEEICRKTHLIPESDSALENAIEAIETGDVEHAFLLEQIELQIAKVKEEAFSRNEVLEKIEKWLAACEEESWLEEYNMDENRYNAGRGTHLTLKRAEKARALVSKLPGMVEALASKITSWESERGVEFTYDGVHLLSTLEEYTNLRQEKEQERKKQRDQKKLKGQLMAEQEVLFGSKPSPVNLQIGKKGPKLLHGGGGSSKKPSTPQTPKADPFRSIKAKKSESLQPNEQLNHPLDDAFAALSAESPMKWKPFTSISSTESPKSNTTILAEDFNRKQNETSQRTLQSNNTQIAMNATPSKLISAPEEENTAPTTMSVPMQTATTPAPLIRSNGNPAAEVEYSFEERRAGFVLPRTHLKT